jgi:hypothetical protein
LPDAVLIEYGLFAHYAAEGKGINPASAKSPMRVALAAGLFFLFGFATSPAEAAVCIEGQFQAGGAPVANSTVKLWAGSAGEPRKLTQSKTAEDGSFALTADETPGPGASLYLVIASVRKTAGDNPVLTFLTVFGGEPPADVTINEMTSVASVWTN